MSMHFYDMSTKLLGVTIGKVNDNLTSVVLAASVITLTVGYISKLLLKQSIDKDLVSLQNTLLLKCLVCVHYNLQFNVFFVAEISTLHSL